MFSYIDKNYSYYFNFQMKLEQLEIDWKGRLLLQPAVLLAIDNSQNSIALALIDKLVNDKGKDSEFDRKQTDQFLRSMIEAKILNTEFKLTDETFDTLSKQSTKVKVEDLGEYAK